MNKAEFIEDCCVVMHNAYEKAAVGAGWETQKASRKEWLDVPEANKATMRVALEALLDYVYNAPYFYKTHFVPYTQVTISNEQLGIQDTPKRIVKDNPQA